jgi:isopentenyldiphosphate isomerase
MSLPSVLSGISSRRYKTIAAVLILSVLLYFHRNPYLGDVRATDTSKQSNSASSGEYLTVYKLHESFNQEPAHLTPVNPSVLIETGSESIDVAHRKGLLHIGAILYVMDSNEQILLMKRSASVVTCPNTWSIVGEHSVVGEDANDLPLRALEEELGLIVSKDDVAIQTLTDYPLYYIRHYGARNDNRIDRQLTYLWLVKLPRPHEGIQWTLDHEVAGHKWITLEEMDAWLKEDEKNDETFRLRTKEDDGPPNGDFCHSTIRTLLRTGIVHLKEILYTK